MMTKLWKLEVVALPESAMRTVRVFELEEWELEGYEVFLDEHEPDDTVRLPVDNWAPPGWLEDADVRAWWIDSHETEQFFWPKSTTLYFSKSSARKRARLIESYGATVNVIESETVTWLTPERIREKRIAELELLLADLKATES